LLRHNFAEKIEELDEVRIVGDLRPFSLLSNLRDRGAGVGCRLDAPDDPVRVLCPGGLRPTLAIEFLGRAFPCAERRGAGEVGGQDMADILEVFGRELPGIDRRIVLLEQPVEVGVQDSDVVDRLAGRVLTGLNGSRQPFLLVLAQMG
jgi:hypothetical protein